MVNKEVKTSDICDMGNSLSYESSMKFEQLKTLEKLT